MKGDDVSPEPTTCAAFPRPKGERRVMCRRRVEYDSSRRGGRRGGWDRERGSGAMSRRQAAAGAGPESEEAEEAGIVIGTSGADMGMGIDR
jgi:hypothetical protein